MPSSKSLDRARRHTEGKHHGHFINDQRMYWLDLPAENRWKGMAPEIFRLAEQADKPSKEALDICRRHSLKEFPWKSADRMDVLQRGKLPNGVRWNHLAIAVEAGVGKTTSAEQMEYLIAQQDPHTLAVFMEFSQITEGMHSLLGETGKDDERNGSLVEQFQKTVGSNPDYSKRAVRDLLLAHIRRNQFVLIVDALDQHKGGEQAGRNAAEALAAFLKYYSNVRCVVTGRPFAIERYRSELNLDAGYWQFVQIGLFTEPQIVTRITDRKWKIAKQWGNISFGVPRWLELLRGIPTDELTSKITSLSHLYLLSFEKVMTEAHQDQSDGIDRTSAWYLFSLLAFEMWVHPDGSFRGQSAGVSADQIGPFIRQVWLKRRQKIVNPDGTVAEEYELRGLHAEFRNRDDFQKLLGKLGQLNENLVDAVIYGNPETPSEIKQIYWRDQTVMDFFCAQWMTRYATEVDRADLIKRIFIRRDEATAGYYDTWRLAVDMPDLNNGRKDEAYAHSMSVLYRAATPLPEGDDSTDWRSHRAGNLARSTEMIWRSWETLQRIAARGDKVGEIARAAFREFSDEYINIRDGIGGYGSKAQAIARDFETWFIPIDPHAAGWKPGDRDVDGELLPIVDAPYNMAKYTVTNGVLSLFNRNHYEGSNSLQSFGIPDETARAYVARQKAPAVLLTWFDASCLSRWLQGILPTEKQWEYAARAGTTTDYAVGDGMDLTPADACFGKAFSHLAVDVDAFTQGNAWGLFQCHGNVWEYCEDWYDVGLSRCVRGGSFDDYPQSCRSALRYWSVAMYLTDRGHGVRVARVAMK